MIVKCRKIISPATKKDLGNSSPWLTVGKEYMVFDFAVSPESKIIIGIQSEHYNKPCFFDLCGFEMVSQHFPSNWVTYFEEGVFFMRPQSWSYDSFYEDLSEEEPKAVELFNKEVRIMYEEERKLLNPH